MKLAKLPIGISTLRTIIEEDYLYVDKTDIAQHIIENGQYYFLSRPRRFGKSLFLDTLRTIFSGDRELFKGLHIYDSGYEFIEHPVIRISFNNGDFSSKVSFHDRVATILRLSQDELDIVCSEERTSSDCFEELIIKAYRKYDKKVVVLIDEYDKPILDNIDDTPTATIMTEELKNFYSVMKGADEYIKLVFITGVSKFSKVSLFSGLNNLNDITLTKKYSTICGYTQEDLQSVFARHLRGQDFAKIRRWYNGYKFLGPGVYNPFDILLFIENEFEYRNYWFGTATPTFLLKLIEKHSYFLPNLENIVKTEKLLNSFDVDYIELETLMWQTGYLTISHTTTTDRNILYHLAVPNLEVQISLMEHIADHLSQIQNSTMVQHNMYESIATNDFTAFETNIKALFACIPYNLFVNNKMYEYEGYYVSVFYSYMKGLGFDVVGEECTNKGRIDLTLLLDTAIYIIEFKTDGTSAIEQIRQKKYHEKYTDRNLPIYLVGIEFDTIDRNIAKVETILLETRD